ncbi:MAG: protease pro-enzyme activation domain-containing protein [Actinomycetota bacterium]
MSRDFKSSVLGVVAAGALVASAFVAAPAVATPAPAPVAERDTATFTVALKYDRAGLLAAARAISTPGGRQYRNFLTLEQAAGKFGVTRAQRTALKAAATNLGMTVRFSPTGFTANLTAPVSTWTKLYGQEPIVQQSPPWLMLSYLKDVDNGVYPPVPPELSNHVRLVFASDAALPPAGKSKSPTPTYPRAADDTPVNLGTPFGPGLDCIVPPVQPQQVYSPNQLNVPYGTTALHDRGLRGAGVRIANLAQGYAYSDVASDQAAKCFDYRAPTIRFTGGRGVGMEPVQGDDAIEGNLDVQVIAGVVPEATRIDYVEVAPVPNVYQSFVESVDLLTTTITPIPDVVTTSFAQCELTMVGADSQRAVSDDHFALLAVLGVTMLAASLDGGSSTCSQEQADPPLSGRIASVAYPASSPWVTGVGGTRIVLGAGNERVDEVVWNDTQWNGPGAGAGTGGTSLAARPWYQRPVTAQDRRLVPDVSAHASTYPGWATTLPLSSGGFLVIPVGGTSAAAPFTAANLALIAAAERKAGRGPLGFVSPLLYDLAANPAAYKTVFYDVTVGNNQRFIEAACCDATKGYDQATGLGSVTFSELIKVIPKPGPGRR